MFYLHKATEAFIRLILACLLCLATSSCRPEEPVTLRLSVALTPQELASFEAALAQVDEAHPEWQVTLEITPQQAVAEKLNAQLGSNTLPDVVRIQGLLAQQWIRRNAFLDLGDYVNREAEAVFFTGPLDQFRWQGKLWGLPDTAAPSVLFYNQDMFDAAGVPYPDDTWTYEDVRRVARLLTLDSKGRNANDPAFDAGNVQQWGWNGGLTFFWQREAVQSLGADWCVTDDCTTMAFTSPEVIRAAEWWAEMVKDEHTALYDPYGGSQTGVPGDPFIAGRAAMGLNGFFAVGQLNDAGNIRYDIAQPPLGVDGRRYTPLSTFGYVISAKTEHPDAAWALVQALLEPDFLAETWGQPGHSVPAVRSAAASVINLAHPPGNQQAIVQALDYGQVFKPYTSGAFEAYGKTLDFFRQAMRGELPVPEAMRLIEATANEILAQDRAP